MIICFLFCGSHPIGLDDIWFGAELNNLWLNQFQRPSGLKFWELYENIFR